MTATDPINGREIALDVLLEVLEQGKMSHLVLGDALSKYQYLKKQDRAFITRLVEGTLSYVLQLDWVINRFSSVKAAKMKPLIRTLLRMSAYQLFYMDRVPDSAAINEAVKLAKKRKFGSLSGFVNGVLRTISREKDGIQFPSQEIRFSIPEWILARWRREYGEETAERIASSFLCSRPLSVRVNHSRASEEEVFESLRRQNISFRPGMAPDTLELADFDALWQVEAFQKGFLTVQDSSSALVGRIAGIQPGDFVLDVCSAPGGKALHAADLGAQVEARDLTERKIALVEENAARCGFSSVRTRVWDARELDPSMEGQADIVLADLPCSGLGIMGKKPEIRLRLKEEELFTLAGLQREILAVVSRYVKPGGTLIYSTCTISREENEENAEWIERELPFLPKEIGPLLPADVREDCRGNRIQLLPGVHPCDGFFLSAFTKQE